MRFLRIVLNIILVLATVAVWEICRKSVLPMISSSYVEEEEEGNGEDISNIEAKKVESPREEISTSLPVVQEPVLEPVRENTKNYLLEKGFSEVAKKAMNSVVNVMTMQIINEESSSSEGMEGMFRGFPFDEIFKDFFGGMIPQERNKVRRANTSGSGFVVGVDKQVGKVYIVTNNHVIDKAKKIVISISDRVEIPAEVYACDQRIDIAVLSVNLKDIGEEDKLVPIVWGDSDTLEVGDWVIAIGNPFGLGNTVTNGIISAKGRTVSIPGQSFLSLADEFIQHSAQINMGNSGGCLLDINGRVIGINNAIASINGGNIGIGFAIPSNIAKNAVEQLIKHKRTFRGWLGAEVHPVNAKLAESVNLETRGTKDLKKRFGAFVARVVPEGPAEKAGIKSGDIILEFNGIKITEKSSLQKVVGASKIGSLAKVKLWRQDEKKGWIEVEVEVKVGDFEKAMESGMIDASPKEASLASKKKEEDIPELGISVSKIPEKMKGVIASEFLDNLLVTRVDETKLPAFFETLFYPGDVIVRVNNIKVTSVESLKKILNDIKNDKVLRNKPIPFLVIRAGTMVMLATTISYEGISSDEDNRSSKGTEVEPKVEKKK